MDRAQALFFGASALFIAYEALKGWQAGVVRQLIRMAALAAAYLSGIFFGGMAVPALRLTGYPDFVVRPLGGFVVGALAYLVVSAIGRVLFKKTSDQNFGLVWFVYGIAGSLCGVLLALFFISLVAVSLRFVGSLAEGIAAPALAAGNGSAASQAGEEMPQVPASRRATISRLVEMKHSLEGSVAGGVIKTLDPVPKQAYVVIEKIGRLSSSPRAIRRFLDYPGAMDLVQRPEITALRDDAEIAKAVREGRYFSLLRNPRIVKAANNPKVAELLGKFELEKALDYAIESDQPPRP